MKVWKRYKRYLLTGEWHIHTNYTDGKNTVIEYCKLAEKKDIPLLAFTEHVRKNITYNFNKFLEDIEKARDEFDIIILSGCEAKVLPGGELDVEKWIIESVDYPILAFHSFSKDMEIYVESLKIALQNKYVNAWAHPGLFLQRNKVTLDECVLREIFKIMKNHDVLLEINKKYDLPPKNWLLIAKKYGVKLVKGNDLHSVEDYYRFSPWSQSSERRWIP